MIEKSSIGKLIASKGFDVVQGESSIGTFLYEAGI